MTSDTVQPAADVYPEEPQMSENQVAPPVGSRLTCSTCGAQVVMIKVADRGVKCCGKTLEKQ